MADKQNENWVRPDVAQDREVSKWALIIPGVMLAGLAAGLIGFNALYGRPNYPVGLYDVTKPVASVGFGDARFQPTGQPVKIDDDRMVAVDYANEGMMIYTTKAHLEGGGGGRPATGAEPTDYSNLYVRTKDGYIHLLRTK